MYPAICTLDASDSKLSEVSEIGWRKFKTQFSAGGLDRNKPRHQQARDDTSVNGKQYIGCLDLFGLRQEDTQLGQLLCWTCLKKIKKTADWRRSYSAGTLISLCILPFVCFVQSTLANCVWDKVGVGERGLKPWQEKYKHEKRLRTECLCVAYMKEQFIWWYPTHWELVCSE